MSYTPVIDNETAEDLLYRKEFYQYKVQDENFRETKSGFKKDRILISNSYQDFMSNYMRPETDNQRCLIIHQAGCHAKDTLIRMYNGEAKKVQDIIVGEKILGDDFMPKDIVALCRGREMMYKITTKNLDGSAVEFVCNGSHLLSIYIASFFIDRTVKELCESNLGSLYTYIHADLLDGTHTYIKVFIHSLIKNHITYDFRCSIYNDGLINIVLKNYHLFQQAGLSISRGQNALHILGTEKLIADVENYKHPRLKLYEYKIVKLEEDDYYGFRVNGNGRYFMDNGIITHNSGKTTGAIKISQPHIDMYKIEYNKVSAKIPNTKDSRNKLDKITPSIFIFGTTGTSVAFYRDLLKFPEFGFISYNEIDELERLKALAESGFDLDIRAYRQMLNTIRRRITTKSKGGFYKFYTYATFVNRIFITNVNIMDVEKEAADRKLKNPDLTFEDVINEYIVAGKIKINKELLAMFKNSFIICDEFHHLYNNNMKNNYGIAIQYLLDSVPSIRAAFLTATSFRNVPTEIVDICSFLGTKIQKSHFFRHGQFIQEKEAELSKILFGKISFLQDINPRYFPSLKFIGEDLELPHPYLSYNSKIPFLKFIRCPMSEYQQNTIDWLFTNDNAKKHIETIGITESAETTETIETKNPVEVIEQDDLINVNTKGFVDKEHYVYSKHIISVDLYPVYDFAFPNPNNDKVGLYMSSDLKNTYNNTSKEWMTTTGIKMNKEKGMFSYNGSFLLKENLQKYGAKYYECINLITKILKNQKHQKGEKIMIYHEKVRNSGIILIRDILLANGFLDDTALPKQNTICSHCGLTLAEHKDGDQQEDNKNKYSILTNAAVDHKFNATRFLMAYSELEKGVMEQNMSRFSAINNVNGDHFKIFLGATIIKESYDFKDIQHQIILSAPYSIPSLKQIIGRCVRKFSHMNLPEESRNVNVYILVNSINKMYPHSDDLSPEEYRYIEKMASYEVIQKIEKIMNTVAIDSDIHRDIIMSDATKKQYIDGKSFNTLYFDQFLKLEKRNLDSISTYTYNAYHYFEEEMKWMSYIIKKLFSIYPVMTYEELWKNVRTPPFGLEINPALFSEGNFAIVLNSLCYYEEINDYNDDDDEEAEMFYDNEDKNVPRVPLRGKSKTKSRIKINSRNIVKPTINREVIENRLINKLFDINDKYIYKNGMKYKISRVGKYYIVSNNVLDIETYQRSMLSENVVEININDYFSKQIKITVDELNELKMKPITTDLLFTDIDKQIAIIKIAIEAQFDKKSILADFTDNILKLYGSLYCLITADELNVNKDLKRLIDQKSSAGMYVGYCNVKSAYLYNAIEKSWVSVDKLSLNRYTDYKEVSPVIGFIENMRFKIRPPIADSVQDLRLLEKGIVCTTKSKADLLEHAKKLGINTTQSKLSNICDIIMNKLISDELKERKKNTRNKCFYFWWDEFKYINKGLPRDSAPTHSSFGGSASFA